MAQTNLIGQKVLGYTVTENLGSGAFGTVYKAEKTNVAGQYVRAVKHITIPTEKQYHSVLNSMGGDVSKTDSYFSQMIRNIVSEIKILNDLTEKEAQNIVRYYENDIQVSESPLRYDIYILMEYLTPLDDYIRSAEFRVSDCMRLAFDVLSGLRSCHDNNVIHRDIKDDNIFVSAAGSFKIGDFGVSKVLKDSSKAETLKGTPNFLAPEVYLGKEGYTKSVDLYSLGIVLYRLLNYNRNPFLPPFPKQYFSQDEDRAFEERISGKIPPLPLLGGNEIGSVIVRAISPPGERFGSAEEFKNALEEAVRRTPAGLLETPIRYDYDLSAGEGHSEKKSGDTLGETLGETIGENFEQTTREDVSDDDRNAAINRHLFETVKEETSEEPPKAGFGAQTDRKGAAEGEKDAADPENRWHQKKTSDDTDRVVNLVREEPAEPGDQKADRKDTKKKTVFTMPVIIAAAIVILIFFMFPGLRFVIFRNPFLLVVLIAAFIAALFFAGRELNKKPETDAKDAELKGREPYLLILDVSRALKQAKAAGSSTLLEQTIYDVRSLVERLSAATDFGTGNEEVTDCENDIAKQIRYACRTAQNINPDNPEDQIRDIRTAVENINFLLDRRMELTRR